MALLNIINPATLCCIWCHMFVVIALAVIVFWWRANRCFCVSTSKRGREISWVKSLLRLHFSTTHNYPRQIICILHSDECRSVNFIIFFPRLVRCLLNFCWNWPKNCSKSSNNLQTRLALSSLLLFLTLWIECAVIAARTSWNETSWIIRSVLFEPDAMATISICSDDLDDRAPENFNIASTHEQDGVHWSGDCLMRCPLCQCSRKSFHCRNCVREGNFTVSKQDRATSEL